MTAWDKYDDEIKPKEKIKVGFMINFKKMNVLLERIDQETEEWDSRYPKSELLKIWGSILFMLLVLGVCSYSIFAVATVPFMIFYLYVIFQMAKVWKRFQYSMASYWGMTILGIIVVAVAAVLLQGALFEV